MDFALNDAFYLVAYYKGANGIVLVYDVSDKKGFDSRFISAFKMIALTRYSPFSFLRRWLLDEQHSPIFDADHDACDAVSGQQDRSSEPSDIFGRRPGCCQPVQLSIYW